MSNLVEKITVHGLHGHKKVEVEIKDNTLVIVGENGSGKTTFLRIVFHFLSGRWYALLQFKFKSISVKIGDRTVEVSFAELEAAFHAIDSRILNELPLSIHRRIMDHVSIGQELPVDLQRWLVRAGLPPLEVIRQLELFSAGKDSKTSAALKQKVSEIKKMIDAQILYLPTYRRIERELASIFEGASDEIKKEHLKKRNQTGAEDSHLELVEFGMADVELAINATLGNLKEFARESLTQLTLRYLGDILVREYTNTAIDELLNISEEAIQSTLDRIDNSILTQTQKHNLLTTIQTVKSAAVPDEYSKIICRYFIKLLRFQEQLKERERGLVEFCSLCNEYISSKKFHYNSATFSFEIRGPGRKADSLVQLSELSSGEKQIVSLFSHLYLSDRARKFFVLIDEPELSLSVPWQRRFLVDIRRGRFCSGLIAVTHSPFIYDNELLNYAKSLGEFART